MKRLLNYICVIELLLFIAIPLIVWIAAVLGAEVNNLVSEEALRWFFRQATDMLLTNHLALLILFLTAVGATSESGLLNHLWLFIKSHATLDKEKRKLFSSQIPPHRKAFQYSVVLFVILHFIQLSPALFRTPTLLSISGHLLPSSPWLSGFPLTLTVIFFLTSLCYATASNRISSVDDVSALLTAGMSRYTILIVDIIMGGLLYHIIKYSELVEIV